MDKPVSTSGRGQLGTDTNSPVSDAGTLAATQNRPNVTRGVTPESSTYQMGLTESDKRFIRDIHEARNIDGTPLRLEQLLRLRAENVRLREDAARQFGPGSKSVAWFQQVIAAYDEEINELKSPLGNAINEVNKSLADPTSTDKDKREKIGKMLEIMHDRAVVGDENDPLMAQGMKLLTKAIDRDSDQKTAALEKLIQMEQASPGSVPEERIADSTRDMLGGEREAELIGLREGPEGEKKSARISQAVVTTIHLVADRRIKEAKKLIEQEKKSMGSVSDTVFEKMIPKLTGDERTKELLSITDADPDEWRRTVAEILELVVKRRDAAIRELIKKQAIPANGITNEQINRAIADLDSIKTIARVFGVAVPQGQITFGTPKIESKESSNIESN